jgi:hypothetical protein
MAKSETGKLLTLILYSGSKGCEDCKVIEKWYESSGLEKPQTLMEIAVDRIAEVHDLSLSPQNKIFLTAPKATSGAQLTPQTLIPVFEHNRKLLHRIIKSVLEHAQKIRAHEIRLVCLGTMVGGTGLCFALRFALLLKNQLIGRLPVTACFFVTAPPLDITFSPESHTDAIKLANAEAALRTVVLISPAIDLFFVRFPPEILPSEPRLPYILRALGLLPTNEYPQGNPFQLQQLMCISSEACYPIVLQTSIVVRFPKDQLRVREVASLKLPEFKKDQETLQQSLNKMYEKLNVAPQPIENEIKEVSEKIAQCTGIRSKRWQKILFQSNQKIEEAREKLQKGISEHKLAEGMVESAADQFSSIQPLIKKLELLLAQLDEELAMGFYKHGLYVLKISPEERKKLGPYSAFEKLPLRTLMAKLGREKELFDLTQGVIEKPISSIFLETIGLRFPEDIQPLESWKVVATASENIEHLTAEPDVHLVTDPVLKDEIVIVAVCMIELEGQNSSFEIIKKYQEAMEKWNIPRPKRISLRLESDGRGAEEVIFGTRLSGTTKRQKNLSGEDAYLWSQLF